MPWSLFSECWALGKCKLKPQWDITSHLSEWLPSERPQITHVGEDVEEREHLSMVGGNVNWCNHCRKQHGSFSKTKIGTSIWANNSILGCVYIYIYMAKTLIWKDNMRANIHSSLIYSSHDVEEAFAKIVDFRGSHYAQKMEMWDDMLISLSAVTLSPCIWTVLPTN